MMDVENDIPKHRKKKKSSTSKSKVKSKHKHKYADCLLFTDRPYKATYCKICGKIDDVDFLCLVPEGNRLYRMMTPEEILEKYKNLELIHVDDIFQKYLPIKVKEEENEIRDITSRNDMCNEK